MHDEFHLFSTNDSAIIIPIQMKFFVSKICIEKKMLWKVSLKLMSNVKYESLKH